MTQEMGRMRKTCVNSGDRRRGAAVPPVIRLQAIHCDEN